MDVPKQVISDLTNQNMGSYEWRMVMVILILTYGAGKKNSAITLTDFMQMTGIKKPHVSRALSMLSTRNIINRMTYRSISTYSIQEDADKWRSIINIGKDRVKGIPEQVRVDFEMWFVKYPIEINKADAEAMYCEIIMSEEATTKDLDDALRGYAQFSKFRAMKFGRDADPWLCMYPTTFLKDNKWREYLEYADVRRKPPL